MAMIPMGNVPTFNAGRLGADRWCLRHGSEVLSWGELERRSTSRAWALKSLGVGKDDIVALSLPNCNALYELSFAIWKLGAVPLVLSSRLQPAEFSAIVEIAQPRVMLASDPCKQGEFGALPPEATFREDRTDPLESVVGTYWKAMTSGGSTGRPKLIVDHRPGAVDPLAAAVPGNGPGGVILNPGPLYHNAPFLLTHDALFRGASVVGMPRFDPEEALRLIDQHKITWAAFMPTMLSRMWRLPDEVKQRYDLGSLCQLWHMAAPMPVWLKDAWIDWLGPDRVWELYAGTERQGSTVIGGREWLSHRGSVGRPNKCEIRIRNEHGEAVPVGEIGEIFMRPEGGAGTTYHYIGATPKASADGFESIGDYGHVDADGYLYIADRRTDMILSGGANIYPAEIEGALMAHPGVESAVVIGLPDADMGTVAHAIVQPAADWAERLNGDTLKAFLRERLTPYKMPRTFEFVDEPLRDDAGKVRRSQLREARLAAAKRATL